MSGVLWCDDKCIFYWYLLSEQLVVYNKNVSCCYSYNDNYNNNFLEVFFIIQEESKAGGQEDRRNP